MRETIRDWKKDWLEANGETDELEVVIRDNQLDELEPYIYEGSFLHIPEELINKKVIMSARIIISTVPERIGAYSLTV